MKQIDEFRKVIDSCTGAVWLQSRFGDRYNLKSELTQFTALADLVRDKNGDLELFAQKSEDEIRLMNFIATLN